MSNRVYPDPAMQSLLTAARRYSNSTNGNDAPPTTNGGTSRSIPIHRRGFQLVRVPIIGCCELSGCLPLDVPNCQGAFHWILRIVMVLTSGCFKLSKVFFSGFYKLSGCLPLDVAHCQGAYHWMLLIVMDDAFRWIFLNCHGTVFTSGCCELSGCFPLDVANYQGAVR